ncbi:MAG TPA: type II toxin-antitoxin system Phd/YefM family antitoxin [Castellaniella sp.]|nr:type II toxin-antitoxin system Phd/YefM family antitoxin [Castellaniella sp.]
MGRAEQTDHGQQGNSMQVLTFTEARAGLKQAMDDVCDNHQPTVITRQRGDHVVMLSLADFNSIEETLYLLSSPENAERLGDAIRQVNTGRTHVRSLMSHDEPQAEEQAKRQGRPAVLD